MNNYTLRKEASSGKHHKRQRARTAEADAGACRKAWNRTCLLLLLLGRRDCILDGFGQIELGGRLGGDLDGFARCGVTAHACLALYLLQAAETGKHKDPVLLGLRDGQVYHRLQMSLGGLVAHTVCSCQMLHYLRLRHAVSHIPPLFSLVDFTRRSGSSRASLVFDAVVMIPKKGRISKENL